jgi:hypothetical protein
VTPGWRCWRLLLYGVLLGLLLGGAIGGLLAGFLFPLGVMVGAPMGALCGLLAAGLSLAAEAVSRRWPPALRFVLVGLAAAGGTVAPMLLVIDPGEFIRPWAWPLWLAGLGAAPIALLMLRRYPIGPRT